MSRTYNEAEGYDMIDEGTYIVHYWADCEPWQDGRGNWHDHRGETIEIDDVYFYHDAARVAIEQGVKEDQIFSINEVTENGNETRWHREGMIVYVNGYAVTRHWGGPEEGGWWFDAGYPIGSSPVLLKCSPTVPVEEALGDERTRIEEILKHHPDIDDRSRFSVLNGTDLMVRIENGMAEAWPAHRPIYE